MWWLLACRDSISGPGPTIYGLDVRETDIAQVLRVTFDTEVEAEGAVSYGPSGSALRVEDHGTEHELLVAGLAAGERVELVVSATGPRGTTVAPGVVVEIPALAPDDPHPQLLVAPDARASGGWIALDATRGSGGVGPPRALLIDAAGQVVWQHVGEGQDIGALDVQVTAVDTVLVAGSVPEGERPVELGLDGAIRWEGPKQPGYPDDGFVHHHTDRVAGGGHAALEKDVRGGSRGDRVVVRDADDEITWSWSTWDHWTPEPEAEEWTHLNWFDLRDDVLYVSDQHSSTIWKIDRHTGAPVWSFGEGGDFVLTAGTWFSMQHAPEWGPDGRLWVYDNGRGGDRRSRVVAYRLDEVALTAVEDQVWDGGADWGWYTGYWGDIDVLANGNLLVSAGNPDTRRVMEVEPASGEVVFALELPSPYAFYRASRVDPARWGVRPE